MVRLNEVRFGRATGLDGVRVNGALPQNPVAIEKVLGRQDSLLYLYKLLADGSTLRLGVVQPAKRFQEFGFGAIDKEAPGPEFRKCTLDESRLALSHQPGIDIDSKNTLWTKSTQA